MYRPLDRVLEFMTNYSDQTRIVEQKSPLKGLKELLLLDIVSCSCSFSMSSIPTVSHVFAGTEKGTLKGINLDSQSFCNLNGIALEWSRGIASLDRESADCETLVVGRSDGVVGAFSCQDGILVENINAIDDGCSARLVGAAKLESSVVTCLDNGCLSCWRWDDKGKRLCQQSAGANVECLRAMSANRHVIATGGQNNDLKLWNAERLDKPLFVAKNVRNDSLDLHVPVWVRSIAFPSRDGDMPMVATGTAYHQVRVYDSRAQRRPVLGCEWGEHPILTIDVTPDSRGLVVANTVGDIGLLDVRTGKLLGSYKGARGSVRQVVCHVTQPLVVSCSLDRHLRVHHLQTRELLKEVYLKQRLTALLLATENIVSELSTQRKRQHASDSPEPSDDVDDDDADETDAIWDNMVLATDCPAQQAAVKQEYEEPHQPAKKKKKRKLKGTSC